MTVNDGVISGGGKSVSFGKLIGGKSFSLTVDHKAPPKTKDAKDFKLVGSPIPRLDIPAKVTGAFTYMQDFSVPDMLHGRVVRPPAIALMGSILALWGLMEKISAFERNHLTEPAQRLFPREHR